MIEQWSHGSTADHAYEKIKQQIMFGELSAGHRLHIEEIAEQLRVSSTPVRESLFRLATERFITAIPRAGFFVKSVSEAEIRDLYKLNNLLLKSYFYQRKRKIERRRLPASVEPLSAFEYTIEKMEALDCKGVVAIINR
jgi:DNA-binding GntR family transcriptional regulator